MWTQDAVDSDAVPTDGVDAIVPPERPGRDRGRESVRDRVHKALFGASEALVAPKARSFGRYVVTAKIGEGAMGEVFRAIDPVLQREVAVKCVHPRLAGDGDRGIGRLLREARSLARLDHPHVVRVFEAGIDDAQPWIAMEYVDGTSLRQWLTSEARSVSAITRCLLEAGRGLAAAHEAGLVHRDFKPDNVLVDADGRAKVGDFGLVRALLEPALPSSPTSEPAHASSASEELLTRDGAVLGTPAYMPPEQLAGDPVDATGDQFAFCITAWEALFGVRPFAGADPMALCAAILAGNFRKRRNGIRVARGVERALRRGLSARPRDRFATMGELLRRLEPARVGAPAMVFGTALLSGGVAVGVWPLQDPTRCDGDAAALAYAGAWDDERREAIEAVIDHSGLPYRTVAAAAVIAALDDRTASWTSAWQSACAAASTKVESPGRIDRRLACLHARRAETVAMVRRLASGDARSLAAGRDAIDGLATIDSCDRLDDDVPAVVDGASAVIDPLLATGRALRLGGYPAAALGPLQLAEIEGARFRAIGAAAEAAIELGHAVRELGDISGAEAAWHRAVDHAIAVADEGLQADAWFTLTQIAANDRRDATRAREALRHGSAVARHVAEPGALVIHEALASALATSITEPADALAAIEAIGRRWGDSGDVDAEGRQLVELAARHRASLLLDLTRWNEAAEEYRGRIAVDTERYGPGHPRVGDSWYGLGIALDRSGTHDGENGSEAAYRRARDIWGAAWPDGHRDIGLAEIALANVAMHRRDLDAAARHADAAMEMYRKTIHVELDAAFGEAWTVKGVVEHRRGKFDEAARSHDEARRVYEATSGVRSVNAAIARSNAAEARLMRAGVGPAELEPLHVEFERVRQIIRDVLGEQSPYLGYPEKGLGLIAVRRGDRSVAHRWFSVARKLCVLDHVECAQVDELKRNVGHRYQDPQTIGE